MYPLLKNRCSVIRVYIALHKKKEESRFHFNFKSFLSSADSLSPLFLLNSLLICQALFSSRPSPQVKFYIHHKSDAAVAIFNLSPIIIVYRQ